MSTIPWRWVPDLDVTRTKRIDDVQVARLRGLNILVMSDESAERELLKAVFDAPWSPGDGCLFECGSGSPDKAEAARCFCGRL